MNRKLITTLTATAASAVTALGLGAFAPANAVDQPDLQPIVVQGIFKAFTTAGLECGDPGVDPDNCAYHPARHDGAGQRHLVFNGWTYYL